MMEKTIYKGIETELHVSNSDLAELIVDQKVKEFEAQRKYYLQALEKEKEILLNKIFKAFRERYHTSKKELLRKQQILKDLSIPTTFEIVMIDSDYRGSDVFTKTISDQVLKNMVNTMFFAIGYKCSTKEEAMKRLKDSSKNPYGEYNLCPRLTMVLRPCSTHKEYISGLGKACHFVAAFELVYTIDSQYIKELVDLSFKFQNIIKNTQLDIAELQKQVRIRLTETAIAQNNQLSNVYYSIMGKLPEVPTNLLELPASK